MRDQPFHVRFVRGEFGGVGGLLLRLLLTPPSWLFAAAAETRIALYRGGVFTSHAAPCPVISVGNLTVGGTGKTPLVEWVVREARLLGRRPAVLSRGYGARSGAVADEIATLDQNVPGLLAVRDPDRVRGAATAIEEHLADAVILDDGFQHLRLARDLDLVTVDSTRPFGGGHCLPRGMLREPVRGLRRAHGIVLTRSDQVTGTERERILRRLRRAAPRARIATAVHAPLDLCTLPTGETRPADALRGRRVFAVSGIGNPEAFERTLESLGARIAGRARFADHQRYDGERIREIGRAARECGAAEVVTTQKDGVKWPEWPDGFPPARALRVRVRFTGGEEGIKDLLRSVLCPGQIRPGFPPRSD